jgi:hypothetical protein
MNNSNNSEGSMVGKKAVERDTGNIAIAAAEGSLAAGGKDSERDSGRTRRADPIFWRRRSALRYFAADF